MSLCLYITEQSSFCSVFYVKKNIAQRTLLRRGLGKVSKAKPLSKYIFLLKNYLQNFSEKSLTNLWCCAIIIKD